MKTIGSLIPEEESIYLIGIDPGSNEVGIAIMKIDLQNKKILQSSACSINLAKLIKPTCWLARVYDHKTAKILHIKKILHELLEAYNPIFIACETPYFNPSRPIAYGVLVEVLTTIKHSVIDYDINKKLEFITPSEVKVAVNASYKGDKIEMKDKVANLSDLNFVDKISSLDDHAIDALAVAYSSFKGKL